MKKILLVIAALCALVLAQASSFVRAFQPELPSTPEAFQKAYDEAKTSSGFQGDMSSQVRFTVATLHKEDGTTEEGFAVVCSAFPRKDYAAEFWVVDKYDPKAKITNPKNDDLELYPGALQAGLANRAFTKADLEAAGQDVPTDPQELEKLLKAGTRYFSVPQDKVKGKWGFFVRMVWWDEDRQTWIKFTMAREFPK